MAISVYQPQSSVGGVADRTTSVKVDNTAERAALQQQAGIGNALLAGAKMYMDQMETADVMKANNEYNDKMSTLRNELMQNKEENALDNMNKYEEGRNKILEEIYSKGPRSVRSGLGRQKFEAGIQKDWIGQKNNMRSYMMQENEKYQDTQLGNALTRRSQAIAENWNNPAALLENVQSGEADIRERYKYYGPEKQEAMVMKFKGQMYGLAMNAAMSNGDYTQAGALLQSYGKFLTPEQRIQAEKAITERKKMDIQLTTFKNLADKYGDNVEGAVAELRAKNSGGANIEQGKKFWSGIMGTHRGSNQCANTVSDYITAAGGDSALISPLADGMQYKAEQKGLAFTDRSQLQDGDIVFWTTGNWTASEDPKAIHDGEHTAYHGTDHVGVYNAATGKVMQSGESGVAELDLDYYKVSGFAHPGGRQKTASELYKEEEALRTYMNGKIRDRKQQEDRNFKNSINLIDGWKKGGMSMEQALNQALNYAGADPEKQREARTAVHSVYYDEYKASTGSEGKHMPLGVQYGIENALRVGMFKNQKQLSDYLLRPEVHASAEQYTKIMHMYEDAQNGKGIFKIDKSAVIKEVLGDTKLKGQAKVDAEIAAWAGVLDYVEKERLQHHRDPSENIMELAEAGKQAMTAQYYGHQKGGKWLGLGDKAINIEPGLLSVAGVDNKRTYQIDGTNDYVVSFKDGRKPRRMSVEELYKLAHKE